MLLLLACKPPREGNAPKYYRLLDDQMSRSNKCQKCISYFQEWIKLSETSRFVFKLKQTHV